MTNVRQNVLVVEDDPDLREITALMLDHAGYPVQTAENGRAALSAVAEGMPALILLDMRMPGMDGWTFAQQFRDQYGRAAPIVVMTAAQDSRLRADEIGAEGYLAKPFDMDVLLATVARYLDAAR
jgi:CheY-like chemotaxis protein